MRVRADTIYLYKSDVTLPNEQIFCADKLLASARFCSHSLPFVCDKHLVPLVIDDRNGSEFMRGAAGWRDQIGVELCGEALDVGVLCRVVVASERIVAGSGAEVGLVVHWSEDVVVPAQLLEGNLREREVEREKFMELFVHLGRYVSKQTCTLYIQGAEFLVEIQVTALLFHAWHAESGV